MRTRSISSAVLVALVAAVVLALAIPPTGYDAGSRVRLMAELPAAGPHRLAAERPGDGTLTLEVRDDSVAAVVTGYPAHRQILFEATAANARGDAEARTDASGYAEVRFRPPPAFRGTVSVTARSGSVAATASVELSAPVEASTPEQTSPGLPTGSGAPGAAAAPSAPSNSGRVGVPISPAGFLGQFNLSNSSYAIANRFVLPQDVTLDRWYFAVNGEGATCVDGRSGYGSGDGGVHYGRIVAVAAATGGPTEEVLASEMVNGCAAHERARREFDLNRTHQVNYVAFSPVTLRAHTMYAFVLSNVDPDPGSGGSAPRGNHMSPNLNFADLADMGPHGRNTLDPDAPSGAYGLDPRETTMWSEDGGRTWRFGDEVGWYDNGDGRGRMWPGGYRVANGPNVAHGWIYMNWPSEDSASVTFTATDDAVLTHAGGASSRGTIGVIAVENLDTGESATTTSLGRGLVDGRLSSAVPVTKGERYLVSTSGQVDRGSAGFWDHVFPLGESGSLPYSCASCANPNDRPMVYAAS